MKYAKSIICLFVIILLAACQTVDPEFINEYERDTHSFQRQEIVRIISEKGAKFKIYSLSDDRIAIIVPYDTQTTNTVDLDDLEYSLILSSEQKKELHDALLRIINIYNEEYNYGNGVLYDYYIYTEKPENHEKVVLLRLQLRVEDKSEKSVLPYKAILMNIYNYTKYISINDVEQFERAIK